MRPTAVLFSLLVSFLIVSNANSVGNIPGGPNRTVSLKEQLEVGLKARRPGEFQYIAKIIQLVKTGQIPDKLVRSTFNWARKKHPYQFPYFERALQYRGRRLGINVPSSGLY